MRTKPAGNRLLSSAGTNETAWEKLRRDLAAVLVRSRLDYTDDLLILNSFFRDFRWKDGITPLDIKRMWVRSMRRHQWPPRHFFSVYIHIPFCSQKCHFCYCSTETISKTERLDLYVQELKREIDFYSSVLDGEEVRLFQVGGGTPNLLSSDQMRDLLDFAARYFKLDPEGLRTIEFNPANTDPEKLGQVRRAGFNRISFGVQSLNMGVLEKENREYQSYSMVRDAISWAKASGFAVVNVDLLLGLASDTTGGFLDSFRKVAELKPTTITVTKLSLTDAYRRWLGVSREEKLRHYETMLPAVREALVGLCQEYGYETQCPGLRHANWVFFLKDALPAVRGLMSRSDHFLGGNFSILGLGRHAWSHLFGTAFYERDSGAFDTEAPIYRLASMTMKEEMARHILYDLENRSRVDFKEFQGRFGADLRDFFQPELAALRAYGKIHQDERGFLYLPQRGPERIFYGMLFLMDTLSRSPFSEGIFIPRSKHKFWRSLAEVPEEGAMAGKEVSQ